VSPVLRPELRYRRLWFCVGVVLAAAITVVCLLPSSDLPNFHLWDKLEHALSWVALAFWFGSVVVRRDIFWVGLALVALGGAIELLQGWMGLGRSADIMDLLADSVGIFIGLLLVISPLGRVPAWLESRLFGARA
jgi:VanZ family protein